MNNTFEQRRNEFIKQLKEDVKEYEDAINLDYKEKAKLDAEKIRKDWEKIGQDFPIRW